MKIPMTPLIFQPLNRNEFKDIFMCHKCTCIVGFLDTQYQGNKTTDLSSTQRSISRVALSNKDAIIAWCDSDNIQYFQQKTYGRKPLNEINYDAVFVSGNPTVKLFNEQIAETLDLVIKKARHIYLGDDEFSELVLKYIESKTNAVSITICYSQNREPRIKGKDAYHLEIKQYDVDRFNEKEFNK